MGGTRGDPTVSDMVAVVTDRRRDFAEWLQDRREVYQQLRRPDIPASLVDAVENFRLEQKFSLRRQEGCAQANIEYEPEPPDQKLRPGEYEVETRERAEHAHYFVNRDAAFKCPFSTAGDLLARVLYDRLCEIEEAERRNSAPVRRQRQLSRRAIADVAYDLLMCEVVHGIWEYPGPALRQLLEKLLGVEDRRLNSSRRFKAKQAAIEADAAQSGLSSRTLGALVRVDSKTITRWRKEPEYKAAVEEARRRGREE